MDRVEKLTNMLVMALADRSMSESEIALLSDRATEWGLSNREFVQAMNRALSNQGKITLPPTHADRLELLRDLMQIMAADGTLADVEKELFARAAVAMEVSNDELNAMIDRLAN